MADTADNRRGGVTDDVTRSSIVALKVIVMAALCYERTTHIQDQRAPAILWVAGPRDPLVMLDCSACSCAEQSSEQAFRRPLEREQLWGTRIGATVPSGSAVSGTEHVEV